MPLSDQLAFLQQLQLPQLSLYKHKLLPQLSLGTLSPTPPSELTLLLGRHFVTRRPVTKLPKLPTSLCLENTLKRIFERFSGLFCVSACLTCENFDGHLRSSLVLVHKLPFPL
jgi:hypothetical protein